MTYIQIIALLSFITIVNGCSVPTDIDSLDIRLYQKYLQKFNKSYNYDEYNIHLQNFAINNQQIAKHNNYNMYQWRLGWTNLTDMVLSDVELNYTVYQPRNKTYYVYKTSEINDLPENVDWRYNNYSTINRNTGNFIYINPTDEFALLHAIHKQGPLYAYISIDEDFMNYSQGFYNSSYCSENLNLNLNHKVVIMGYGNFKGILYYVIKNDWGETWGLNGYALLNRWNSNICGIMNNAYFEV